MQLRWRSLLLGLCFLWFAAGVGSQTLATVVLVTSERSAPMVEAAEALVSELVRAGHSRYEMLQLTVPELATAGTLNPKLFVAIGSQAAQTLARADVRAPVLCILLPRQGFERALQSSGRKPSPLFSAIYLDQPLSRQLALIRLAVPDARRLGVLWGPESTLHAPALRSLAQAHGLTLLEAAVGPDNGFFRGMKTVLEDADLLFALPDPQVFNSSSIQNILLTSFRAKVPLVAFSPAYVKAGALMALHVTPAQVGRQAAVLFRGVLQGKGLPAQPVYSSEFSVAVNEHVARSLGLTLDAQALGERLRSREATP